MTRIFGNNSTHAAAQGEYVDIAARRFRREIVRRIICGLCAVILMCCMLFIFAAQTRDSTILVASRDISQGHVIRQEDINAITLASSSISAHVLGDAKQAIGAVARTSIAKGDPLVPALLTHTPQVPNGYTTVSLQPASMPADTSVGDTVQIVSTQCMPKTRDDASGDAISDDTSDGPDRSQSSNTAGDSNSAASLDSCTISNHALLSGLHWLDSEGREIKSGQDILTFALPKSGADTQTRHVTLDVAVPATEALTLVQHQEQGGAFIIAAVR